MQKKLQAGLGRASHAPLTEPVVTNVSRCRMGWKKDGLPARRQRCCCYAAPSSPLPGGGRSAVSKALFGDHPRPSPPDVGPRVGRVHPFEIFGEGRHIPFDPDQNLFTRVKTTGEIGEKRHGRKMVEPLSPHAVWAERAQPKGCFKGDKEAATPFFLQNEGEGKSQRLLPRKR